MPFLSRSMLRTALLAGAAAACAALLAGCDTLANTPKVDIYEPPAKTAQPPAPALPMVATGGLYSKASYRPSFEDRRARLVGDTVTITIVENVSASQVQSSSIDKSSAFSSAAPVVPLIPAATLAKLEMSGGGSNTFEGKGGTTSANTFTGSITATVVEVLPNGHLVVTGEKQIGVNQNVDVLRFSGTVDPRSIQAGSIVSSQQVANVRVESRSRGQSGESQIMPWLARFFLSVLPF